MDNEFEQMLLAAGRKERPNEPHFKQSLHAMESAFKEPSAADIKVSTIPAKAGEDLKPGSRIDNFKIIRLLGKGAMGAVYLARDRRLGRKVALKVVLPKLVGSKTNLVRLGIEAQLTAKLNHPHVVTIYAVGQLEAGLYVALEYLEGQSLRKRLEQSALSMPELLNYGTAIAEALAAAHEESVLHRDLKPENVMLPTDGRLRVVDFGLARRFVMDFDTDTIPPSMEPSAMGSLLNHDVSESMLGSHGEGTPAYMAPEQWHSQINTHATDIWALGVMLYEMVLGKLPFPHQTVEALYFAVCVDTLPSPPQTLPEKFRLLLTRCLERDPDKRPSAYEVAETLKSLNDEGSPSVAMPDGPYRGLMSFAKMHSPLFFGREAEVAQFLEKLRHEPILPVVGASGVGKTSFIRAGVCPVLQERDDWKLLYMRPGTNPFMALAWCLYQKSLSNEEPAATTGSNKVVGNLYDSSATAAGQAEIEQSTPGLLTETGSTKTAAETLHPEGSNAFVEKLSRALFSEQNALSLTLREWAESAGIKLVLIVDQLEELFTLCQSAEMRKRFLESLCVAADDQTDPIRIVFSVRDDFLSRLAISSTVQTALQAVTVLKKPDARMLEDILRKPLALTEYRFDDEQLVNDIVESVEQETAALSLVSFTAQLLWERRDEEKQLITRQAYASFGGVEGAIATHADGVLDGCSAAEMHVAHQLLLRLVTPEGKRRVVARSAALEGLPDNAGSVLRRFVSARLITSRKVHATGGAQEVQLALAHESLVTTWPTLARWLEEGREELGFLSDLQQGADLWAKRGMRDEELLVAGALTEALRFRKRDDVQLPPHVVEFLDRSQISWRAKRRRKRIGFGVLVAIGAFLAVYLNAKNLQLAAQKTVAERQRATALVEGAKAAYGQGDLLEARAKLRLAFEREDTPASRALWWQLRNNDTIWRRKFGATLYSTSFSPDGQLIGVSSLDHSVYLLNARTKDAQVLRGHQDQVTTVAFSPDGTQLLSGDWSGTINTWQIPSGNLVSSVRRHTAAVKGIVFWKDGSKWASVGGDGFVRVWNRHTGKKLRERKSEVIGVSMALSPDNKTLAASGRAGHVELLDASTLKPKQVLRGQKRMVFGVTFSPNSQHVVSTGIDHVVRMWNVKSGKLVRSFVGHRNGIFSASFHPDGKRLLTAGYEKDILMWNVDTGAVVHRYRGHEDIIRSIQVSPDGESFVSAGNDTTVRLWKFTEGENTRRRGGHNKAVVALAFTPDGSQLASAGEDLAVRQWDVASGTVSRIFRGHRSQLSDLEYSPDGQSLAAGSHDKKALIWDVSSSSLVQLIPGHSESVQAVAFNQDGHYLVTGSGDKIRLWKAKSGFFENMLSTDGRILSLTFDAKGDRLVSTSENTADLWQFSDGSRITSLSLRGANIREAVFLPDGKRVATVSDDRSIRLWDARSGALLSRIPFNARIYSVSAHPDGKRLAIATSDYNGYILDLESKTRIALRGHVSEVNRIRFNKQGDYLATASDDGTVRTWRSKTGEPFWRAPALLRSPPRLLSHQGWRSLERGTPADLPKTKWRTMLETRARRVATSPDGDHLCVDTIDNRVELWSMNQDTLVRAEKADDVGGMQALSDTAGCVFFTREKANSTRIMPPSGPLLSPRSGPGNITALGVHNSELFIASGNRIHRFDNKANALSTFEVGPGVTAVARIDKHTFALGYRDGNLQILQQKKTPKMTLPGTFESTPSSPVTTLRRGPLGSLIAGFANGALGMWTWRNAKLLILDRLHGPVAHVLLEGQKLYVASDLGDHLYWDLSPFFSDSCIILNQMWSTVPVIWRQGMAVAAAAPGSHKCLKKKR